MKASACMIIGPDKQYFFECKIIIIFLLISLNICFRCSKEPSHRDSSFEYPQHMFWLKNKKFNFNYTLLSGGLNVVSYHVYIPSYISSETN